MSFITAATSVITLIGIMLIGVYSGRSVKNSADFDSGGKSAGTLMVAGTILGTLVGGSATIGTSQLAFDFGLSAWWFGLGCSIGCLIMGLFLSKGLRRTNCITIQQMISEEYGSAAGVITSVLGSVGIMLNVVSQILAANALLYTMFGWSPLVCALVSITIMAFYIVFGGVKGAGLLGIVKFVLIYITVVVCGLMAFSMAGGFDGFAAALPADKYFNFFARGFMVDFGACFSVVLGVFSSQAYVQGIIMGKDLKAARNGTLLSAFISLPVGILCVFIGYYMRMNFPEMSAASVLPQFVLNYTNDIFAGVAFAAMLIAVVGTGAGMALGFGIIMINDIYKRFINKNSSDKASLFATRVTILGVLVFSALFTLGNVGSAILTFGFLSMGLRAAVLTAPMFGALFLTDKVDKKYACASSFLGFGFMMISESIGITLDPLLAGMILSFLCLAAGYAVKMNKTHKTPEGK